MGTADEIAASDGPPVLPSYLVVVDNTDESRLARRYAVMQAARVGATVSLLYIIPPSDFVQWGGVQELLEEEEREKAEKLLQAVADEVRAGINRPPAVIIRFGNVIEQLLDVITEDSSVHAVVLGAAAKGVPGPLVTHFAGETAGALPCLVIVVPGALSEERLKRLASGEIA
jgi:nucleotide-binding universal stress UspA family protein